jgi:hypothetical protein
MIIYAAQVVLAAGAAAAVLGLLVPAEAVVPPLLEQTALDDLRKSIPGLQVLSSSVIVPWNTSANASCGPPAWTGITCVAAGVGKMCVRRLFVLHVAADAGGPSSFGTQNYFKFRT